MRCGGDEGVLGGWRKYANARAEVRCGGGKGTLVRIRMYANARAEGCWGGGASTLVRIRMYANAWAYIRKYVSKGALPWGGRVQPWGRR